MKRLLALPVIIFFSLLIARYSLSAVQASSQQAYQDYLFQSDTYRQKYSEFQVAKNEYLKFKTLAAETSALEKTKAMLAQRDQLLRAYLLLLNERLNEDAGLTGATKGQYQTMIANEVKFLESHASLIPSIGSIEDGQKVSEELESHYTILQTSVRQIITGLSLGQLALLSRQFDQVMRDAQNTVTAATGTFTLEKQATLNRWLLQITNKRALAQQKIDSITQANAQLEGNDVDELDSKFRELGRQVSEARQYLVEGASFLGELKNALKYID